MKPELVRAVEVRLSEAGHYFDLWNRRFYVSDSVLKHHGLHYYGDRWELEFPIIKAKVTSPMGAEISTIVYDHTACLYLIKVDYTDEQCRPVRGNPLVVAMDYEKDHVLCLVQAELGDVIEIVDTFTGIAHQIEFWWDKVLVKTRPVTVEFQLVEIPLE